MRDLTIGPAGSAVCLWMVRGAEAPPMLRGIEYARFRERAPRPQLI